VSHDISLLRPCDEVNHHLSTAYASIDDLRSQLGQAKPVSEAYAKKMLHAVPIAEVVDRSEFILERCKGRTVLDVGASGPMHDRIVAVAAKTYGWDREDGEGVTGIDLDNQDLHLPFYQGIELIVCGEVIEHLSNPGQFLRRLRTRYQGVPVIITVPNAFAEAGRAQLARGTEVVNRDHCAWYSWKTLSVLLERAGYSIAEFCWYNGRPLFAEGLIVVTGG